WTITDPTNTVVEQVLYSSATTDGRVTQQTFADGQVVTFTYLTDRTVMTTTGATGQVDTTTHWYNPDNTLARIESNGTTLRTVGYATALLPDTRTTLQPDMQRDALGNGIRTVTNPQGAPTQQFNALGQSVTVQYDASNRPTFLTDTRGISTRWIYDTLGNPT